MEDQRMKYATAAGEAAMELKHCPTLAADLIALSMELRKPRLTLPNELLEAGGWHQVTMQQSIGVSSTGWRLVWDALRAALHGRSVQHFDKPFVLSLWIKPGQDTYAAAPQAQSAQ